MEAGIFKKIILLMTIFIIGLIPLKVDNISNNNDYAVVEFVNNVNRFSESISNMSINIRRATIYHAVPWQTNNDNFTTASGFQLNTDFDHYQYRILAVSRDLLKGHISYGDTVLVTGTGTYDGLWRVEDTMNRRYTKTIDFLVDLDTKFGLYSDIELFVMK